MALALGLAGASVMLVARREATLDAAAARLRARGIVVRHAGADLPISEICAAAGRAECGAQARSTSSSMPPASTCASPSREVTPDAWSQQLALHLAAPFFLTQALAPGMAQRGYGRILNIASLQSTRAFANSAPYGAGKGGVVQLTRAIAQAWSGKGITCNAIGPGFFPTALTAPVFDDAALLRVTPHAPRSDATAGSTICTAPRCSWPARPAPTSPARR